MRPKKPAAIRMLEGNRGKRKIPSEPQGIGYPIPPAHLTVDQLDRWNDIVTSLPVELLTRADVATLERMAIAWATYREATLLINRAGLLTRGQKGDAVYNPLLRVRSAAADEMNACTLQLGLSPLARARLATPTTDAVDDPLETLLGPYGKAWGSEHIPAINN